MYLSNFCLITKLQFQDQHIIYIKQMRVKSKSLVSESKSSKNQGDQSLQNIVTILVPKHLDVKKKRIFSLQKLRYQQTIAEKVQREKKKYMKPLTDVELILKKFDQVVSAKKSVNQTPRLSSKIQQKFQTDLEKRIKSLLSLPTIKNIKKKVQNAKTVIEPQTATLAIFTQGARLSILKKYDDYIMKASKPVSKRIPTI